MAEEGKERDVESSLEEPEDRREGVLYSVDDTPPWYLCLMLGFQVCT